MCRTLAQARHMDPTVTRRPGFTPASIARFPSPRPVGWAIPPTSHPAVPGLTRTSLHDGDGKRFQRTAVKGVRFADEAAFRSDRTNVRSHVSLD